MTPAWKTALKTAITDPAQLLKMLALPSDLLPELLKGEALFPLRVPLEFVARMEKGNPKDPLLLQILPFGLEAHASPGFVDDPLEEQAANPIPGLLHKYYGRVLLIANGLCAVNCRYCFRRNFPYEDHRSSGAAWTQVLDYIEKDPSISEVILSGGDPLTLTDSSLKSLFLGLQKIPHVSTLRFHSRIPVVLPERIDADFLALFAHFPFHKVMVLHVNHPNELNTAVHTALSALKNAGFTLLNQSVLLKGINDEVDIQIALQKKLFASGVLPYYLHLLDHAKGTAHFEVDLAHAQQLMAALRLKLPGYLVPQLAREVPGLGAKQSLIEPAASLG